LKQKSLLMASFASLGMLILILDGKRALEGAAEGITICLRTVIPSLFPFFVLSNVLTTSLNGVSPGFLRPLGILCCLPAGCEGILISAFLGGYPVGAQCVAAYYHAGTITKAEAERMLGFCSNAGPAFIFGMLGTMFPQHWMVFSLWFIHIVSAILVAHCFPMSDEKTGLINGKPQSFSQILHTAIRITSYVCGWVILFRIVLIFLESWCLWLLPVPLQVAITGVLELANGCSELLRVEQESVRFIIASGMLALGGFCVMMQTASVTSGLSLRYYCIGKLLQTFFSLIISCSVIFGTWYLLIPLLPIFLLFKGRFQNNGSISRPLRV